MSLESHYPLSNLISEAREETPEGQTYAVKRATMAPEVERGDIEEGYPFAKLKLINATPEEYILENDRLGSGLAAANIAMLAEEISLVEVERTSTRERSNRPSGAVWSVQAVGFGGQLLLPNENIPVVGAYVPGEEATGFVHVLDTEQASFTLGLLFKKGYGWLTGAVWTAEWD
jgi:hypothetical protein